MTRTAWLRMTILLAITLGAFGAAADPADRNAEQEQLSVFTDRLSRTVTARIASDDVAGAVIVVLREGAPVWSGAFGFADPAEGRPMTEEALFRVESLSKPVTAWGAMRLAERGQLDLNAPSTDCLRRWQPPGDAPPFTARQLLSQTAGVALGDFTERYAPNEGRPALPDHLNRDFGMIGAPGAGFSYSDTGYTILELMIADCAGEEFATYIARQILAPLGMASATYDWPDTPMPLGHDLHGTPVAPYVYPGRGSGGLLATAADMARFAAAGMAGADQPILSADGVAALHQPVTSVDGLFGFAADGYALGHFTETLSDGRRAVWHGGQGYGWMSHMHLVPETGDGIVILSNSQRAWPLFAAILRDWSDSLGVAPVGMVRVLWAGTAARIVIGCLVAISATGLWLALRRSPRPRAVRGAAAGLALVLMLWPPWAMTQDYLFLFSILPGLWPWLGGASVLAGIGLVSLALAPGRPR